MESVPYSTIQRGTFLIATPDIDSGLFFRSVVLVCEHNIGGSFGLIINRSVDLELPEEIFHLREMNNPHVSVRASGPVQTNQMMLLHTAAEKPTGQEMLSICENVWLGGDLHFSAAIHLRPGRARNHPVFWLRRLGVRSIGKGISRWSVVLGPCHARDDLSSSLRKALAGIATPDGGALCSPLDDS